MSSSRILLIGGVGLTKGRVRNLGAALKNVSESLGEHLREIGWPGQARFESVSLILRYGIVVSEKIEIGSINDRYKELNVAVQVCLSELQQVQDEPRSLEEAVRAHTLRALKAVATRYNLPAVDA
jgi:hypothetical protein